MTSDDLLDYLYFQIPLSKAMGIEVEEASLNKVILKAPLAPNINHKKTVFGGSLHAVATLSCWSLIYLHLKDKMPHPQIVITKSNTDYHLPVRNDFKIECLSPEIKEWSRFHSMYQKKGKGRIELLATIYDNNKLCMTYKATFAALNP